MKTSTKLLASVFGLLFTFYGSASLAGISSTAHDLSSANYTTEICNVCHTPHAVAARASTDAPLWDRSATVATFTPYAGTGTLNATVGQPASVSRLCLSCHDGTVALDSFGGAAGTTVIGGVGLIGTDLTQDHPISFVYETVVVSDGALDTSGNAYAAGVLLGTAAATATVECASCHDVHNTLNLSPFLRIDNAGSGLCLTCHLK